jgi:hypothetical protein
MATEPRSSWFGELVRSCLPLLTRSPPSSPVLSASNANASNTMLPIASSSPDPVPSTEPVSATAHSAPGNQHFDRNAVANNAVWGGLKLVLRGLEESLGIFPPLKVAVGGLVACVRHFEVRLQSRSGQVGESKEATMYRGPNRTRKSTNSLLRIS